MDSGESGIDDAFAAWYGPTVKGDDEELRAFQRDCFFHGALYAYQLLLLAWQKEIASDAFAALSADLHANIPELPSLEQRIADNVRRRMS